MNRILKNCGVNFERRDSGAEGGDPYFQYHGAGRVPQSVGDGAGLRQTDLRTGPCGLSAGHRPYSFFVEKGVL